MKPAGSVVERPDHVRPEQVYDFDIHHDERLKDDLHAGYRALQVECPDIFYTLKNGGHWMVTRYDLIEAVMRDHKHFSNKELEVPKTSSPFVAIPINLDPPAHTPYRVMLMRYFSPKVVTALDATMRQWAERLIDKVYAAGGSDFSEDLGAAFPVSVFMEMAGLPLEKLEYFRTLVFEFFQDHSIERHLQLQREIVTEMEAVIDDRMAHRRDDLVSKLIDETIDGRPITKDELKSICLLLFLAGLDTVANAMTFAFRFLAGRPDLQDRLRRNPTEIPDFVEESLRRFAIVNGVRLVKQDIEIEGATFRAGDMVVAPLTMAGMDERRNPDPTAFKIERENRRHMTFSTGPHLCLGHFLARAELRIFVQVFLNRIPRFSVVEGFHPSFRAGLVMALEHLPLEWPVETVYDCGGRRINPRARRRAWV